MLCLARACRRALVSQSVRRVSGQTVSKEDTSGAASSPLANSLSASSFVIEPIGEHRQTLIWLHGIGDLKTNFKIIFGAPEILS